MSKFTIEHRRDGECIERWHVTEDMIQRDGVNARVVFPAGGITLASFDELHFCIHDAIETLSHVRDH